MNANVLTTLLLGVGVVLLVAVLAGPLRDDGLAVVGVVVVLAVLLAWSNRHRFGGR